MIELTRRWFVFGSAAAIAATQIPLLTGEPILTDITAMPARHFFLRRHLIELMASFENGGLEEAGAIKIIGPRGDPFLNMRMNTKAIFRWTSLPGHPESEMVIFPDQSFSFVAESNGAAIGKLKAIFMDYIDDGPPVYVEENYPNGGEAPRYLYADNTREARDARWQEMKEAAKREWVEEGLCDEDYDVDTPIGSKAGTT